MAQIQYEKNDFHPVTLTFNSADELAYITEILLQPSDHKFRKRNLKTFDADIDMELYGLLAEACLSQKVNYEHYEEEPSSSLIILDVDHENNRTNQQEDRPAYREDCEPEIVIRLGNKVHGDCVNCA